MKIKLLKAQIIGLVILAVMFSSCEEEPGSIGIVLDGPVAGFTLADTSDVGLNGEIKFLNTSQNGVTYLWDFGDGNTSDEVEPIHVFTEAGTYQVVLQATNGIKGSYITNEFTQSLTIKNNPFAWFKADSIAKKGVAHAFINKSTRATSYLWEFGDDSISTEAGDTVYHVFAEAGNYTVTLTAYNNEEPETQWTKEITVIAPLLEEFFDDGIPSGWTVIDGGTTGETWADSVDYSVYGGPIMYWDYVAISSRDFNYNLNEIDDWLITSKFTLESTDATLSVDVLNYYSTDWGENPDPVDIYISTTTPKAGEMTYYVGTITHPDALYQYLTYDFALSDVPGLFAGAEVYIGFHVSTNNSYNVQLDNVVVI